MTLLFVLLAAGQGSWAQAQTSGDCSSGAAVPSPDSSPDLVADCESLLAARDTLAGTASLNWSSDTHIEAWDGIEVGQVAGRVIGLDLMAGIDIEGKGLSGQIPPELGMLRGLEYLRLGNQFSVCSDDECRQVEDHERNQLTGSIPVELAGLPSLIELDLSTNQLNGEIPFELGNLNNLSVLRLGENDLTGSVPISLGDLSNLEVLDLAWNELSGEIPSELGTLAYLTDLYLDGNEFTGSVPAELGSLSTLEWLSLSWNELSGEIPPELGNLSKLTDLYLDGNELTGSIPAELGDLSNLEWLGLAWNQMSGEIPIEFGNLTNLTGLYLNDKRVNRFSSHFAWRPV